MNQKDLNHVNMKDWEDEGACEIELQLPLTAKHSLAVSKWKHNGKHGADLRRYSYNENRLLASGISLTADNMQKLYDMIHGLHKDEYFTNYGGKDNSEYKKIIEIDEGFTLSTEIFENFRGDKYFCINMNDAKGNPLKKGWYTYIGIMVRFDTISEFLNKCQSCNLVKTRKPVNVGKRPIDKKTGRKIY